MLVKEDKEDEEMVKQVGRKVVIVIMCPVRSGTTQQAYTVHGQ